MKGDPVKPNPPNNSGDENQSGPAKRALTAIARDLSSQHAVQLVLLLLPAAAAAGGLIRVIGPLFAFRVMLLFIVGVNARHYRHLPWRSTGARLMVTLVAVWLLFGYTSMLWATDLSASVTQLFGVTLGLGLCVAMAIQFARDPTTLRNLIPAWAIAFALTGIVATYERASGHHLPNYLKDAAVPGLASQRYVASVFGNPNAYAAFLVTAFPFLLWGLLNTRSRIHKTAFGAGLGALPFLLLLTGSRLCLAALSLQVVVSVAVLAQRRVRIAALSAVAALLVIIASGSLAHIAGNASLIPSKLLTRMSITSLRTELTSTSGSGGERANLLKDGLWMVSKSHGLGVGAGNFEANVPRAPFPAHGMVDPHNLWLEILTEYGALVFLLFTAFIGACFWLGYKLLRHANGSKDPASRSLGLVIVISVLGNIIAAVANSTYLESSTNWLFLASLGVMAAAAEQQLPLRAFPWFARDHAQPTQMELHLPETQTAPPHNRGDRSPKPEEQR